MAKRLKFKSVPYDMGGGFWVYVETRGSRTTYEACQLQTPGGLIANGRREEFSSRRAANEQVDEWKRDDVARLSLGQAFAAQREQIERAVLEAQDEVRS